MTALRVVRFVAWAAVALLAGAMAVVVMRGAGSSDSVPLPLAATIGGPFELTDANGKRFHSKTLLGKPYAVFFGFTNCPDVCPTTLLEMTNRLAELGPDGDKLRVVFISVDEADTPEHLKTYIANFDKRIVALTGTAAEIAATAKTFRALYEKVPTKAGYTINHTATVFLMDAKGQFRSALAYTESADIQRAKLKRMIAGT